MSSFNFTEGNVCSRFHVFAGQLMSAGYYHTETNSNSTDQLRIAELKQKLHQFTKISNFDISTMGSNFWTNLLYPTFCFKLGTQPLCQALGPNLVTQP